MSDIFEIVDKHHRPATVGWNGQFSCYATRRAWTHSLVIRAAANDGIISRRCPINCHAFVCCLLLRCEIQLYTLYTDMNTKLKHKSSGLPVFDLQQSRFIFRYFLRIFLGCSVVCWRGLCVFVFANEFVTYINLI